MAKTIYFQGKKIKDTNILNKRTAGETIIFAIVFVLFLAYAVSLVVPLLYLFVNSFQDGQEYINNLAFGHNAFAFPTVFKWQNYVAAFDSMSVDTPFSGAVHLDVMFLNSIWYVAGSVSLGVIGCCFTGYVLSKYRFVGQSVIYAIIIFTMTIPIVGSTGSTFKLINDMGIYDTPMFLITSFGGFGFNFLILYGFFKNLSWSYAEAVFVDGGGDFTAFFKVMLPMAKAPILTLVIMATIGAWNDYSTMLLYLPDYPTVASGLYGISQTFRWDMPVYFAGLTLSIIPVLVLFASCSETIMKNFTMGGLKG